RRWPAIAALAAGIAALVVAVASFKRQPADYRAKFWTLVKRDAAPLLPNRVYVQPFKNLTNNRLLDQYAGFAAAQVIDALSRLKRFEVLDDQSADIANRIVAGLPPIAKLLGTARALANETRSSVIV